MAKYKAFIVASGALFALARAAGAADLLPPPPALEPLPPAPIEFSGWYLRGDLGLAISAAPKFDTTPDALASGIAGGSLTASATEGYFNPTISESGFFDFGFGYQFNNWFRADVTEELRGGGSFQGLEIVDDSGHTGGAAQWADFYRANLSSYVTLLNLYGDLGTWYGVTPYVGGGIGFAYNRLSGATDIGSAAVVGSPTSATGGYLENGGKWNFAWSLGAGLDFDVTQNLKLELGYRYLNYGGAKSGVSHCLSGDSSVGFFNCSQAYYLETRQLASNDFRIGLRWMIGEATAPAPVAPLVRKY
jgi:opacity protein-like surface antigen